MAPCSSDQRAQLGSGGAGRDSAGRYGTGRDGTGRDGTGRGGTGRDGTGRDGTGRDGAGRDSAGRYGTGRDSAGRYGTGLGRAVRDGTGRDGTGRDGTGRDGTGRDGTGRGGTDETPGARRHDWLSCQPAPGTSGTSTLTLYDRSSFGTVKLQSTALPHALCSCAGAVCSEIGIVTSPRELLVPPRGSRDRRIRCTRCRAGSSRVLGVFRKKLRVFVRGLSYSVGDSRFLCIFRQSFPVIFGCFIHSKHVRCGNLI